MSQPIDTVLDQYAPMTSEQIRTWSSGAVKRRLHPEERRDDWRVVQDTLWDQRIFGCVKDWECACGKFKGYASARVVCNICGVKVVSKTSRTIRFGHINLTAKIPHPFFADTEPLNAVPVVPACFWEKVHGEPLANAYEELLRCSLSNLSAEDIMGAYGRIIALMEQRYEAEGDPEMAVKLARGMALKERDVFAGTTQLEASTEVEDEGDDEDVDWDDLKLAPLDDE
jgi:DNA-directed RNA polymerase beta' subunit